MNQVHVIGAIDPQGRCRHYHGETDIVAIRFKCCGEYYGCFYCHEEAAGHAPIVWPRSEWQERAIACGNCGSKLTIHAYMQSGYRCPSCDAAFNPGCRHHYELYFEWPAESEETEQS